MVPRKSKPPLTRKKTSQKVFLFEEENLMNKLPDSKFSYKKEILLNYHYR